MSNDLPQTISIDICKAALDCHMHPAGRGGPGVDQFGASGRDLCKRRRLRASWRKFATPPWGKSPQLWHRGFAADIAPLTPGRATELAFDFFPVFYVFRRGHRVRVSIVTSLGERAQVPPLAGGRPVTLTLHRDAAHPSAIHLPIVR